MLDSIKKFLQWPIKGISNINEFGAYLKSNWISLGVLFLGALFVIWLFKKTVGFVLDMFKS